MKRPIFIVCNDTLFVMQHLRFILDAAEKKDIYFVTGQASGCSPSLARLGRRWIRIHIKRDPSLVDIFTLAWFGILRILYRPRIVISFTPKGSIMNALTCWLGGKTYHYFTGQRWATMKGTMALVLMMADRTVCALSSKYFADSFSQSRFLGTRLRVRFPVVLGAGSLGGVDLNKFYPSQDLAETEMERILLYDTRVSRDSFVFGYVGRLNRDKGIFTLLRAFSELSRVRSKVTLVLVGPTEMIGAERKEFDSIVERNDKIVHVQYIEDTSVYYRTFDAFILPSYREGFGTVLLEAAASKIPIIASEIPGPMDFIEDGMCGMLFKAGSVETLYEKMSQLYESEELREVLSLAAYDKCKRLYSSESVHKRFLDELCGQDGP